MREILFRGKRTDGLGWAFGDLLTDYIHHEGWTIVYGGCMYFEVNPETVGQYTGLKDMNGMEIYEGDVVEEDKQKSVVCWVEEVAAFAFVPSEIYPDNSAQTLFEEHGTDTFFRNDPPCEFVVRIGTIHDNPDLEESDAVLFGLPDAIVCPHCGGNATINLHTEQGELIDYFYECSCGGIFEDTKNGCENVESIKIVKSVKTSEVE